MTDAFHDALVTAGTGGLPDRFFDRFVFNLHPAGAGGPLVIFGLGVYPARDVVDGFALLVTEPEQRNLRFSTELSATEGTNAGPFSWATVEPMRTWRARLRPNPAGLEFDLTWRARTPAWTGELTVANTDGSMSSFAHLFQSGRYDGTLSVDGQPRPVQGWYGQRDRSRGLRTMAGGQGLHIWFQAQFPDRSIGFVIAETRQHEPLLTEGAVMHESGDLDLVTGVRHGLRFDAGLDLMAGTVEVSTASGAVYLMTADASGRGGYMSGAGYGGQHGRPMGRDHVEHDVYALDGSVSPRTLDSALTDRLAAFTWNDTPGSGVFEFALTRSNSYTYQPTLF
ncbi:MAG TPA: hypothetical protein VGH27_33820 [Streptosporangiaceae bacterium]|jgi:hypothetical protein